MVTWVLDILMVIMWLVILAHVLILNPNLKLNAFCVTDDNDRDPTQYEPRSQAMEEAHFD